MSRQTLYNQRWRAKNPERVRAYNARYWRENKARIKLRRILRKRGTPDRATSAVSP
jgi:beta-N-acetylglucosaminidase